METGQMSKCEGRDVHGLQVSYNHLPQFQFAEVDRAVSTRPLAALISRSNWKGHFVFFDLCYDIWREHDEVVRGMQHDSIM